VIPGASLQVEGRWTSIRSRGLGDVLGELQPDAKRQPKSLGQLLMPHRLFEGEQDSPLLADYVRVSAKEGADPETHEFYHLKSAKRRISLSASGRRWITARGGARRVGGWRRRRRRRMRRRVRMRGCKHVPLLSV
jgi:hypothetical protein